MAGKISHAACLLCTIKPLCAAIWVAVSHGPDSSRGPPNTVWSKQIQSVSQWTTAFFVEAMPDLRCTSTVVACLGHGPQAEIGGSLHHGALAHGSVSTVSGPRGYPHRAPGFTLRCFSYSLVTQQDSKFSKPWAPSSRLGRVKIFGRWKSYSCFAGRQHHVAAVCGLLTSKKGGVWLCLARELALNIASGAYMLGIVAHLPVSAHETADKLSFCSYTHSIDVRCVAHIIKILYVVCPYTSV